MDQTGPPAIPVMVPAERAGLFELNDELLFRVADIAIAGRGDVVAVASAGTHEVVFYDLQGKVLGRAGRDGSGPGEFRWPVWLQPIDADSVLVFDMGLARLTVLDIDGAVVRTSMLEDPRQSLAPMGLGSDGTAVFGVEEFVQPTGLESTTGRFRVLRYRLNGSNAGEVGVFPGRQIARTGDGFTEPLLSVLPSFAVVGRHLWQATGLVPEVREYRLDGTLERIVRWSADRVEVTAAHKEALLRVRLGDAKTPEDSASVRRSLAGALFPETLPHVERLIGARHEGVWVELYRFPGDDDTPRQYFVIGRDGAVVGEVDVPRETRLYDVGAGWAVGVSTNELGVERLVAYDVAMARRSPHDSPESPR